MKRDSVEEVSGSPQGAKSQAYLSARRQEGTVGLSSCALFLSTFSLGWVRYAERVLGRPIIPHLCTAKSPQQVMGSLVKDYFARQQVSQAFQGAAAGCRCKLSKA